MSTRQKSMTKVKFISSISKMGDKRLIINIPERYIEDVKKTFKDMRQIRVVLDDEI